MRNLTYIFFLFTFVACTSSSLDSNAPSSSETRLVAFIAKGQYTQGCIHDPESEIPSAVAELISDDSRFLTLQVSHFNSGTAASPDCSTPRVHVYQAVFSYELHATDVPLQRNFQGRVEQVRFASFNDELTALFDTNQWCGLSWETGKFNDFNSTNCLNTDGELQVGKTVETLLQQDATTLTFSATEPGEANSVFRLVTP